MGEGNFAGAKIGTSTDKGAQTGAVVWGAIRALADNVGTESIERVKFSYSNLFS